jgi:hypothetical protein
MKAVMDGLAYRYRFAPRVSLDEAKETLMLAVVAVKALFGGCRVRMDAAWASDESLNVIVIDAGTLVGMTISLIFTAFAVSEFGSDAVDVRQVRTLASDSPANS